MNVLIVGSGAREHAIAWKVCQSPRLNKLLIAPGNAGTAALGQNLEISASDCKGIVEAAKTHHVDLVIIGPEEPLVRGLATQLTNEGIAAFGPSEEAAALEGSKAFAKEFCERHNINHARGSTFTNRTDAINYVRSSSTPLVVKANGLAAGKGVFVCDRQEDALSAIQAMMVDDLFGAAGQTVVIEERLLGREISAFAISDGRSVIHLASACDYKRIHAGDEGSNTGGMGSYSPPIFLGSDLDTSVRNIQERTIQAMAEEGRPYQGVLFTGLMIEGENARVLEFNCRFGDPETQVILPRLKSDLLEIIWAVVNGRLQDVEVEWSNEACVSVVLASGGYPDDYRIGYQIAGLSSLETDALVFHAGTSLAEDGSGTVTAGGRVLSVVATAPTLADARAKAYRNIQRIHFTGSYYRNDIAAPSEGARIE